MNLVAHEIQLFLHSSRSYRIEEQESNNVSLSIGSCAWLKDGHFSLVSLHVLLLYLCLISSSYEDIIHIGEGFTLMTSFGLLDDSVSEFNLILWMKAVKSPFRDNINHIYFYIYSSNDNNNASSDLRYKNKGLHPAIFHSLMNKVSLTSLLKFMKVITGFTSLPYSHSVLSCLKQNRCIVNSCRSDEKMKEISNS